MLTAAPGCRLIGADFSAIESRVLAWLAGETWKLQAYCKFDVSHDPRDEVYCINACKIYHVPEGTYDKKSPERKIGKTCDVAFGFMGGLGAFRKFEPDQFTDAEVEIFKNSGATRILKLSSSGTTSITPQSPRCASAASYQLRQDHSAMRRRVLADPAAERP
jgi:hypothetical protein